MLRGVRVLEVGHGVPGPMTGMILGDLGAEVIKIEGPGGDPFSNVGAYQTWNRNKTVGRLNLRSEADTQKLHNLLAGADVFIDSSALLLGSRKYAPRVLLSSYPSLVVCSISAFPPGMGLEHLPAWDALVAARAGVFDRSSVGSETVDPSQTQLPIASTFTALVSAHAIAGALRMRDLTGKGQTVRVSMMDALFQALGLRLVRANWSGEAAPRRPPSRLTGTYRCSDGRWIQVVPQGTHVGQFLSAVGLAPAITEDSLLDEPTYQRARARLTEIMATRPAEEWEAYLSNAGLCGVVCRDPIEWIRSDQARDARLSVTVSTPFGPMLQPGPLLDGVTTKFSEPLIVDDCRDLEWPSYRSPAPDAPAEEISAPLAGIRVLDMSLVLAGPTCGRLLAQFGAEVIKVDGPDTLPSDGIWLDGNRGKRSIGIDLKTDEGRDILWDLIDNADVIVENFTPGTAERLGFGYKAISARRPGIVYVDLTCFGHDGPMAGWHGWEHSAQAASGLETHEAGPGGQPTLVSLPLSDYGSAYAAAIGVVNAIRERDRTGKGALVRSSLAAPMGLVQSLYLNDYPGKRQRFPEESRNSVSRVLRCSDGYVYAQCPAERWYRYFADTAPEGQLEAMFDGITCEEALGRLATARIPSVKLHRFWDVYEDEEVRAAGLVRTTVDPAFGIVDHVGTPYHASWEDPAEGAPVPLPGQHSVEVLTEIGYSPARVAQLIERGAVLEGSGLVG